MIVGAIEDTIIVDITTNIDDTMVKESINTKAITEIDMSGINITEEMTVNIGLVNITMINKIV
jgi:hypothetical protein